MVPSNIASSSARIPASARARRVVSRLTLSAVTLFILCGTVGLIVWLSLHPCLPAVRVESLSVSGFNLSASQLSGKYIVVLNITNPNRKIDLSIDQLGSFMMYRGLDLSRKAVDFNPYVWILRTRDSEVKFEMETYKLNDKTRKRIVGNLGWDWSKGLITFNLRTMVRVKFRAGRWLTKQKVLYVMCKNLNIEFVPTKGKDAGKLHDERNTCTVDFD